MQSSFSKKVVDSESNTKTNIPLIYEPLKDSWTNVDRNNFMQYLSHLRMDSAAFPKPLATVPLLHSSDSVQLAFQKLIENKAMAIPVIESNGSAVGMFGVIHVIALLLKCMPDSIEYLPTCLQHIQSQEKRLISSKLGELLSQNVSDIQNIDPVFCVPESCTLLEVIKLMVDGGCHRILVYKEVEGIKQFVNVVSQSTVVMFISTMMDFLPEMKKTIEELHVGYRPVISVTDTQPAVSAFKTMIARRVSGIAVVNAAGILVGNISVNDIKLINYDLSYFNLLTLRVKEYLQKLKEIRESKIKPPFKPTSIQSYIFQNMGNPKDMPSVVTCLPNSTLAEVVKLITFFRVHRVYIVDNRETPRSLGIIALHDILQLILHNVQSM